MASPSTHFGLVRKKMLSINESEKVKTYLEDDTSENWQRFRNQIETFGVETVSRLANLKVLLIGLNGVGIEIAKNLVMSGVGYLTIYDDTSVTIRDLGTNFLLSERDLGKPRSKCCYQALQGLGSGAGVVSVHKGQLTERLISGFDVIIDTCLNVEDAIRWNNFCRNSVKEHDSRCIHYIRSNVYGLAGFTFVDLGSNFHHSRNCAEGPRRAMIESLIVQTDNNALMLDLVTCYEMKQMKEDSRICVKFMELDGELGKILNNQGPFELRKIDNGNDLHFRALISNELALTLPAYSGGGIVEEIIMPEKLAFHSLESFWNSFRLAKKYMHGFETEPSHTEQLHLGLCALWSYELEYGQLPVATCTDDVDKVLELAHEISHEMDLATELNEEIIKVLACFAQCQFQPLCSVFGGVVVNEVIKSTGIFDPLQQWLHIEMFKVLPCGLAIDIEDAGRMPKDSRYDDVIMMFGHEFHRKVMKSKTLLAGYNAVGSELLKNFALLGVSCCPEQEGLIVIGEESKIHVSDSSCYLNFKEHSPGLFKSSVAAEMAHSINSAARVLAKSEKVHNDLYSFFGSEMFKMIDVVIALGDNKVKQFVYNQCIHHEKAILECRVDKMDLQTLVNIPHLTYVCELPEKQALPVFPSAIRHMRQTHSECYEDTYMSISKSMFEKEFNTSIKLASDFISSPNEWLTTMKRRTLELPSTTLVSRAVYMEMDNVQQVLRVILRLITGDDKDFATKCILAACSSFNEKFNEEIKRHIKIQSESNLNIARIRPATLDLENPLHLAYLLVHANFVAIAYGFLCPGESLFKSQTEAKNTIKAVISKECRGYIESLDPKLDYIHIKSHLSLPGELDDEDLTSKFASILQDLENISRLNGGNSLKNIRLQPIELAHGINCTEIAELKDDYIKFVVTASNLQAWNFSFDQVPQYKYRLALDEINSAVVSVAAITAGLMTAELFKSFQPDKDLDDFFEVNGNLKANKYEYVHPAEPERAQNQYDPLSMNFVYALPQGFTIWDKTVIDGDDYTLSQFLTVFKAKTGLNCIALFHPDASLSNSKGHGQMVYSRGLANIPRLGSLYNKRMNVSLKDILIEIYGLYDTTCCGESFRVILECMAADENDEEYKIPRIDFHFG